uniref:Huntingtin-interacting protein 1-related protein n=1 Tax=Sinocyclocheilus rhinocerous TaxID=307959 RepID=A0A673KBI9_9TELE
MDRVKSSMQQVPNPIPKVLSRRTGGANSLEAEKENFERSQAVSINKAINTQEIAVKEKHARNILLFKGAHTFWLAVNRLPLSSNAVLCWKFCHVFHKLLRDGHPNVIKDSMRHKADLNDMSRMWVSVQIDSKIRTIYSRLYFFFIKYNNPRFPGNLQMSNRQLDEAGENDVNNFFQLTVEMFDYLECELNLFLGVLGISRTVLKTTAFQRHCALSVLSFSCPPGLPADTLQGHRDRFQEQFKKLKSLFYRSSNLQYFKRLIQIPQLPEVRLLHTKPFLLDLSPKMRLVERNYVTHLHICLLSFLASGFSTGLQENTVDRLIEQLTAELQALKEELESFRLESGRLCQALRGRVNELEAELAEQTHLKQQALGESEFLRVELDDLRRVKEDTEKEQRSLSEIERKAQANEQRYTKLKEKYTELVQSHADLLRKNAEVTRQMTVARAAQDEVENVKKEMQDRLKAARDATSQQEKAQLEQLQALQAELMSSRSELETLKSTVTSSQQSNEQLGTQLSALESEKAGLMETVSQKEAELASLGVELERVQSSLTNERESGVKAAEALQNQLNEKESREQSLESELVSLRWAALRAALEEAGRIVQDCLNQLEDPAHISCTSSADYLVSRCQVALDCVERLQSATVGFISDNTDVSGLVRAVTQFAHLLGDVIVQGSATSHMVPVEQADALADNVKACGAEALALLCQLKEQKSMGTADCSRLRAALDNVMALGEKLRPRGLELQQGELGDLVEQEMAATSAAVESAAARIEEMLNKSRAVDTGIKMEVNERILASCTDLMQAIKVLVLSSKDLQRDIVESGRGAASMKEFYAKNSRWTEGLISASKAVGWGATMLVDAADQVVQGTGKFEELMVCSHEIAASTAQLVAASKVKADKDSPNLSRLRQASKGVTQATAGVVASTKSGKSQIEDTETMDFSAMTLTQIKRQEMDAQVLVLELETRLQKERERLGELRKKHYELAGVAEGWGGEEEGKTPNNTTNSCLSTTQYRLTISQNCFLLKNLPRIP